MKKYKQELPDNCECFICGKKIKPNNWFKTEGKYFCSEKHLSQYENTKK